MNSLPQKRLAADVLNVGIHKVWLNPDRITDIKEALTKQDIRDLIKDGAIKAKATNHKKVKKKTKKRTTGKIKKRPRRRKEKYIMLIRKLRRYLTGLKENKIIISKDYQRLRRLAKAGNFKSIEALKEYVKTVVAKEWVKEKIKEKKK